MVIFSCYSSEILVRCLNMSIFRPSESVFIFCNNGHASLVHLSVTLAFTIWEVHVLNLFFLNFI